MIDNLVASDDCQHLTVTWESGEETVLSAACLRKEAKDAWSIRERIDNGEVSVAQGIRITGLTQIGNGVNIHFSDGHDKAIYPFPYLRELSDRFDK
ncbi:gamma-butyrobetaine hydroxylase-like domain-containing protein [Silicimonas sp. MF1-12-2]|uniref:gamma-butyrobetaine hydroxylase-like domain-containing protein n=1 Tax=Silicimonas sp. MF1-12-2 TaxID=3384793 RepID=UPI0039B64628